MFYFINIILIYSIMEAAVLGILILSGIHINNNTTKDIPKIQVDNNNIFKNKSIFNANKVKK